MRRSIAPARLAVLVLLLAVGVARAAAAQTYGTATLAAGFTPDPQRLTGVSGGPLSAQAFSPDCRGYIAPQASHAINVVGGLAFLRLFVEAANDTTLVVRAPNGQFICNDDRYQYNPGLDAAVGAGTYLVWVGTYAPSDPHPYTLSISELRTTVPAPVVAAAADAGAVAVPSNGPGTSVTITSGAGGRISDNHTTNATAVLAQPCVVNGISLRVRGNHTYYSDLIVRLTGPNGHVETLQSHTMRSPFRTFATRQFKNSQGAGNWVLSITDDVGADGGNLDGFALTIACQ